MNLISLCRLTIQVSTKYIRLDYSVNLYLELIAFALTVELAVN